MSRLIKIRRKRYEMCDCVVIPIAGKLGPEYMKSYQYFGSDY